MPRKYRRRKPARGRRKWRKKRKAFIPRSMPNRKLVKMRYVKDSSLDVGVSGFPVTSYYSLNSIYDPWVTGVGNQPMSYDQWSSFYGRYTVLGAKATVTYFPTSNNYIGVTSIVEDQTPHLSLSGAIEARTAKRVDVSFRGVRPQKVVQFYSAKKWRGVKDIMDDDTQTSTFASNPSRQDYLEVNVIPLASENVPPVYYTIEIDYVVMLTDPRDIAAS